MTTKARLRGGLIGEAEALQEAVAAFPSLRCPTCNTQTTGVLSDATSLYQRSVQSKSGKTVRAEVPPCPLPGLFPAVILAYTVEPCGCRVSTEWASAFAGELTSRLEGRPPKPIVVMTEAQRKAKLKRLERGLSELYSIQAASDGSQKEAADYWIVIVADQIQRTCPGAHNMAAPSSPITPSVVTWANENAMAEVIPRTPPAQSLLGLSATQMSAVLAALPAVVRPRPADGVVYAPEISQTRNGQWGVRQGPVFRVFLTFPEAQAFAATLPPPTVAEVVDGPRAVVDEPKLPVGGKKRRTIRRLDDGNP